MVATSRFPLRIPILPPDVNTRVQSELQPGERLVWAGQPNPRAYARGSWVISIFGVVFTAFAAFWILMAGGFAWFAGGAVSDHAGGSGAVFACFPLFGVPFLLIGIALLFAPVWTRRAARRAVYAITDRRAIAWQARPFGSELTVRSFAPAELTQITRVERADGTGDLVFLEVYNHSVNSKGHRSTSRTRFGFLGIDAVRDVEDLLRQTLPLPA
jgi:hypothetical protein